MCQQRSLVQDAVRKRAARPRALAAAALITFLGLAVLGPPLASAAETLGTRVVDPEWTEGVVLDASRFGSQTFHIVVKRLGDALVLRTFDTGLDDFRDTFFLDATGGVDATSAVDGGRVVWVSEGDLVVRKFNSFGEPDGSAQTVVSPALNVTKADVAVDSGGRTLVVWSETRVPAGDPPEFLVFGRFFASDLTPDGGVFEIDNEGASAIVSAVGTDFAVAWHTAPDFDTLQLALLGSSGNEQWRSPVDSDFDPGGVVGLADGSVMLGYGHDDGNYDSENAYVQLFSNEGVPDADSVYRLSLPRDGEQAATSLGLIGGDFVAAAYHSTALGGLLDFVHLDSDAAPRAATAPLVDNARLGNLSDERICRYRPVISAGGSANGPVAVFYSSTVESTPNTACFFPTARMVLLPVSSGGSSPPCPAGVSCSGGNQQPLIPFRTSGPAENRLNVVLRPAEYEIGTAAGLRRFRRELRDVVLTEIVYGSRQHREHRDKFNFLHQLTDAELKNENQTFGCEWPIGSDFDEFQEAYPWVYAVGGQMNPDFYTVVSGWCAEIGNLANGGGTFTYPAGIWASAGVFEHELAHAVYGMHDEYAGGGYGEPEPPAPLQHQWLTEAECRDVATAEGVVPDRCRLACLPDECDNPQKEWYTYEFAGRDLTFNTQQECLDWVAANSPGAVCVVRPVFGDSWFVPELRDLMAIRRDATATTDPTDRTRFMNIPSESFQQACEQRPLSILTDPRLDP